MAKSGWFGGNPSAVFSAPIDVVVNAYFYEQFTRDYEATYMQLNKEN